MKEVIENIDIGLIVPSRNNRTIGGFNQKKLEQLAESIRSIGVQQPAVVRPKGDGYEIVCGERRWRASQIAEMSFLPCRIRDLTDSQALHIQIIENVQREDVHPFDEADGYDRLRKEGGFEVEQIAAEIGRTPAHVYQRLKLLSLSAKAKKLFLDEKINTAIATQLARLDAEQQEKVVEDYLDEWRIQNGVSVKDVSEYIQRNIMRELSKAAWTKTDATLVPSAGACSACPKRTGASPALFDELNPKKDHCLDENCYTEKGRALVEKRRKELEGVEHLIVKDNYTRESIPGAVENYQWNECKKDDEGALRVLVVAGDKPGRLTYGKMAQGYIKTEPKDAKAARSRERKLDKAREDLLISMYTGLQKQAEDIIEKGDLLKWTRFVVKILFYNSNHEAQLLVAKRESWEKQETNEALSEIANRKIDEMSFDNLLRFLSVLILAPLSKPWTYSQQIIPDNYNAAAEILKIDLESCISEISTSSGFSRNELLKETDEIDDDLDSEVD